MAKVDKLIVTNKAALKEKYGSAGWSAIDTAVRALVSADAARGLTTKLVGLDEGPKLGKKAVDDPTDPKTNKIAIDAAYKAAQPDYLMILGAVDVVPHQNLRNPLFGPDDDDRFAYGDLPYACEAPYSQTIGDFRGPTRVVGRLPDLTGGTDPKYLVGLLKRAAGWKQRPRSDYDAYLGISAAVWKKSTALSLQNVFGSSADLKLSPKDGPKWSTTLLRRRSHFINCHGAEDDSQFYGQLGNKYPVAHAAKLVTKKITDGSVLAAECCFGAMLYDPSSEMAGGQMSICNTYLASGAYGVLGSSTIAYGPSEGNGAADLICQFFFEQVLAGASLGRAMLEARQRFVQAMTVVDPADQKTLGQFSLLGDPSIHPVTSAKSAITKTRVYAKTFPTADGVPAGRGLRRERLAKAGLVMAQTVAVARPSAKARVTGTAKKVLEAAARESGVKNLSWKSFTVADPARGIVAAVAGKSRTRSRRTVQVATASQPAPKEGMKSPLVLIAIVEGGKVERLRRLHGK